MKKHKANPPRVEILETGINLTTGDRNNTYGEPHHNLTTYAKLIESYLYGLGYEVELDATDGAMFMQLAKTSRVAVNKQHMDNYVDGAVYFAIGGECATLDAE